MKITILTIGKFDKSPLLELYNFYHKKLKIKVDLIEVEVKISNNFEISKIKNLEASHLKKYFPKFQKIIALDEKGDEFSSKNFAKLLNNFAINSASEILFVIGGAYGLDDEIKSQADLIISLSKMTFPHLLARIILIEQIYRAHLINQNHPYHKD